MRVQNQGHFGKCMIWILYRFSSRISRNGISRDIYTDLSHFSMHESHLFKLNNLIHIISSVCDMNFKYYCIHSSSTVFLSLPKPLTLNRTNFPSILRLLWWVLIVPFHFYDQFQKFLVYFCLMLNQLWIYHVQFLILKIQKLKLLTLNL